MLQQPWGGFTRSRGDLFSPLRNNGGGNLTSPWRGGRNLRSKFRVGGSAGRLDTPTRKIAARFYRPPRKGEVKNLPAPSAPPSPRPDRARRSTGPFRPRRN